MDGVRACTAGPARILGPVPQASCACVRTYLGTCTSSPVPVRPAAPVPQAQRILDLYPQAVKVGLQSGHCPHDDTPQEANRALLDWLAQLPPPAKQ